MTASDTIYALATAPGRGGVAVIRVSGPQAAAALLALARRETLPPPRKAVRSWLTHPLTGAPLDDGLALWFPAPASFTGEDVVELHLHGGRAVVRGVAEALSALASLRPAEPGEFTRRAFLNGKLDLTAAEGLADLIDADTEAQRVQALRQLGGALASLYDGWRAELVNILAYQEATIDFPDEEIPSDLDEAARGRIAGLAKALRAHLADDRRGERLRDGVHIAIVGPPNAGKSSLLNVLAKREAAIVSEQAGTTRDVIEVHLDLGGYPVVVADTAGLRESGDLIESEGIRRARERAEAADLRIALFDGSAWPEIDMPTALLIDATPSSWSTRSTAASSPTRRRWPAPGSEGQRQARHRHGRADADGGTGGRRPLRVFLGHRAADPRTSPGGGGRMRDRPRPRLGRPAARTGGGRPAPGRPRLGTADRACPGR